MSTPTTQSQLTRLVNATDIIDDVANGPYGTVTTDQGEVVTVLKAITDMTSFNPRGAWVTSTAYSFKDLVVEAGVIYVVVLDHTSGVFATDLAAGKLAVYQNVGSEVKYTTVANMQSDNTVVGTFVYVIDSFEGSWWKCYSTSEIIPGESQTEVDDADESIVFQTNGNFLVFDVDRNAGLLKKLDANQYRDWFARVTARSGSLHINCYGDSITFGQADPGDAGAVDRIGDPTNFGDGSTYAFWQYTDNYPDEMNDILTSVNSGSIVVSNRGYSGDTTSEMYNRHKTPSGVGISTVMIGTNDVIGASGGGVTPSGIVTNAVVGVVGYGILLKRFVTREILRGNSVVILGQTHIVGSAGWEGTNDSVNKLADVYNTASKTVADELGVTYIDTRKDIIDQYSGFRYGFTHPTAFGHRIIGRKLASLFIGAGYKKPYEVLPGTVIPANSGTCSMSSIDDMSSLPTSDSNSAPFLDTSGVPYTLLIASDPVMFSFYCKTPGLVVYPALRSQSGSSTFNMQLDSDAEQGEYMVDAPDGFSKGYDTTASPPVYSPDGNVDRSTTGVEEINKATERVSATPFKIEISTIGWHTLSFSSSVGSGILLDAIQFISTEDDRKQPDTQGLWTPSSSTGLASSYGTWYRNGNLITCIGNVVFTGTGDSDIGGLPFPPAGIYTRVGGGASTYYSRSVAAGIWGYTILPNKNGTFTFYNGANFYTCVNGDDISFMFTYSTS